MFQGIKGIFKQLIPILFNHATNTPPASAVPPCQGGTTGGSDMEQHHGELVLPVGSLKNSNVALDKQK
jgi:hypothetical protein